MGKEIRGTVMAAAAGVLMILGMTGLFGWLMLKESLDISHMDLMSAGVLIAGSAGTALSCRRGEGSVKRICTSELVLLLFLGLVNLMLFDGQIVGVIPCVILVYGTAGGVLLASLGAGGQKNGKYRRRTGGVGKLNKKYRR